jgi:hypothetical protein
MDIPPWVAVWLLTTYSTACDFCEKSKTVLSTLFSAVYHAFDPRVYFFFDTLTPTHAYRTSEVNQSASSSADIDWTYNADSNEFFDRGGCNYDLHRRAYPYLSIELVKSNGRVAYDLTDFIENLRIYSDERRTPSVGQVLEAWSLSSHIVVNPELIGSVRLMNENGEAVEMSYKDAVLEPEVVAPANDSTVPTE